MALDMGKHLGISIKDYLDSTPREIIAYVSACEMKIKAISKALDDAKRESANKKLNSGLGGVPPELDI